MSDSRELVVQASVHPSGRWITIPVLVGKQVRLRGVLDSAAPISALSPSRFAALSEAGLVQALDTPNRYRLAFVTVQGQPAPDLDVGIVRRLDRLDVDALIGLNFLMQFAHIHFDTAALRLRLVAF